MKRLTLTLLACLFLSAFRLLAQSPENLPECLIDYPPKHIKINDTVIAQIDSVWDALPRGNRIRLVVLDRQENKLKDGDRMILSQKRCSTMVDYIQQKNIGIISYALSIEPFDKGKKKSAVSEMSNGGYRNFTNREGVYSVILYKEGHEPIPFTGTDSLALAWKDCQEFSANPHSEITITGNEGTVIKIPADALVNLDGTPVNCSTVKICLREFYSNSDIVGAGLSTHTYKRQLETGGMIFIEAKCVDKTLRLISAKPMQVMFPTNGAKKIKGMHTFYGKHTDGLTNWLPSVREEGKTQTPATTPKPTPEEGYDSVEGGGDWESEEEYSKLDYYFLESSRMGWINCDHFIDAPDKVDLYVATDTVLKPAVRLVFRDIKSVMPGYYYSGYKTVKFDDIPKGQAATVVVFAQKGDKYYLGTEEVKVGQQRTYEVPMTPMSKAEFQSQLKALD